MTSRNKIEYFVNIIGTEDSTSQTKNNSFVVATFVQEN